MHVSSIKPVDLFYINDFVIENLDENPGSPYIFSRPEWKTTLNLFENSENSTGFKMKIGNLKNAVELFNTSKQKYKIESRRQAILNENISLHTKTPED